MKKLLILLLVGLLISCSNEKPKNPSTEIFLENQVFEFVNANSNWTKNVEIEAQTTEKFQHKLINLSNEANFLTDFPLQLKEIRDTVVSSQDVKLVVFKTFKTPNSSVGEFYNQLELEIDGIFPADEASKLIVGKKYTLKGMLYKQGKRKDVKFFHGGAVPIYSLGKYTFWNIEVKPLK